MTRIVGILNVTPDSFSDGGLHFSADKAVEHALQMLCDGAQIIDIGGESTRPGSAPVSVDEEVSRVVPVISALRKASPGAVISVDTTKPKVAEQALRAGADIVNDISGLRSSPEIAAVAAGFGAGMILMHMRGTPLTMQNMTEYGDLVPDIIFSLEKSVETAKSAGIPEDGIVLDPGIGFAKTAEQNLEIIRRIGEFRNLGYPILAGPSRKSFIGSVLGRKEPSERVFGTAAAVAWLALKSVDFVRVHDVREMSDLLRMLGAISGMAGTAPLQA